MNGTGKTTTIGKLAAREKADGLRVVLAAADTFRAAAIDQLRIWSQRAGVELVAHAPGADPGAVVFDALDAAVARDADLVIADTAGRLHTKSNLMDELTKVRRIIDKRLPGATPETLFVLDATTGQNGLTQAKAFHDAVGLTGVVLTKLDSTAKGGIVFAIEQDRWASRSATSGWGSRSTTSSRSTRSPSSRPCSTSPNPGACSRAMSRRIASMRARPAMPAAGARRADRRLRAHDVAPTPIAAHARRRPSRRPRRRASTAAPPDWQPAARWRTSV